MPSAEHMPMLCFIVLQIVALVKGTEPNPPTWPSSVAVFSEVESVSKIQSAIDAAYALNGGRAENGQFSKHRFAFLFKPGKYTVDVPVGYYTQVLGLGKHPTEVVFTSSKGVFCEEANYNYRVGALDTFWRGAENFQTDADFEWNSNGHQGMIWAASQATSLRNLVVTNDLDLYQFRNGDHAAGFASGGYMANTVVKGQVGSGSQQQFLSRNNQIGKWEDGVWNVVNVGTVNAPKAHCGANPSLCSHPYVTVDSSPVIAEKPYISIDSNNKYTLNIPSVGTSRVGVDVKTVTAVSFAHVYVATAADTATKINRKLSLGLHVVLSPGIYSLDAALHLQHNNQVLLGLGLATLVATNGTPAVIVGNVDGVRVAGVLLEAGSKLSETLLDWGISGDNNRYAGNKLNPGVMSDIFARVGGPSKPSPAQTKSMLRINSGNVIVDNSWLWRADHVEGGGLVRNGDNPVQVGGIINGDNVVTYGFKAEHALTDQIQWNGNGGQTYMFQSEMPYDVTQANFGDKGYSGYKVASNVETHVAHGVGVYHYFRDHPVVVQSAIVAPDHLESSFFAPLAVFLNGQGKVEHVLNDKGSATKKDADKPLNAVPTWVCDNYYDFQSKQYVNKSLSTTCKVGDPVTCPGSSAGCAGNSCCPDGSTCPSAVEEFACCPSPKKADCLQPGPPSPPGPTPGPTPSPPGPTPAPPGPTPSPPGPTPTPAGQCRVGQSVSCPGSSTKCAGDACCPDGSTCPSAHESFDSCMRGKTTDCLKPPAPAPPTPAPRPPTPAPIPGPPTPAPTGTCKVGDPVTCPGTSALCGGDQCCMDGSTCPSASEAFTGCPKPKTLDCVRASARLPDFVI